MRAGASRSRYERTRAGTPAPSNKSLSISPDLFDDPAHWYARAEEARTLADQMKHDEKSREAMLRVVADYERLAKHAEERAKHRSKDAEERAGHH
jgi:hypothetical protein